MTLKGTFWKMLLGNANRWILSTSPTHIRPLFFVSSCLLFGKENSLQTNHAAELLEILHLCIGQFPRFNLVGKNIRSKTVIRIHCCESSCQSNVKVIFVYPASQGSAQLVSYRSGVETTALWQQICCLHLSSLAMTYIYLCPWRSPLGLA